MNTDLRMMALDSVLEYEKTGRKLDAVVHEKLRSDPSLTSSQKGFYIRLTQGCVENLYRLDHMIAAYSNTPLKKIRPVLLWILRLGAYQITEMDGTPASAAVNEAVKMAEKKGFFRLKGFVNAVLRNMIRDPGRVVWPGKDDPVRYLSVFYSQPPCLAEKFMEEYGFDTAERICAAFLIKKPDAVHIRLTGSGPESTLESLRKEGVEVQAAPWPENAFYISGYSDLSALTAFRKGEFFVQDISSQLAVYAAGIKEGDSVLDVCAAPGGKSLLAADILSGTGRVISRDVSEKRVEILKENIERMGFKNICAQQRDALDYDADSAGRFDVVLADAPCSGYGVIGKKPDIKYGASAEKEKDLAALQRKILHCAAAYVKPGGTLIYSTCTISKKENEENAGWFLKEHETFRALDLEKRLPEETGRTGNQVRLLPDQYHDGFFIAAFRRTEEMSRRIENGEG